MMIRRRCTARLSEVRRSIKENLENKNSISPFSEYLLWNLKLFLWITSMQNIVKQANLNLVTKYNITALSIALHISFIPEFRLLILYFGYPPLYVVAWG